MYIYCFSNDFVLLKKFFPANSRNNLKSIRTGQNLPLLVEVSSVGGKFFKGGPMSY